MMHEPRPGEGLSMEEMQQRNTAERDAGDRRRPLEEGVRGLSAMVDQMKTMRPEDRERVLQEMGDRTSKARVEEMIELLRELQEKAK